MQKILVIEDDPSIQKSLKTLFESEGFAFESASDGLAGLKAFEASPPAVVILDLKMPQMTGRDVCRAVKKQAPNQPIIVLSAAAEELDKVLLLELGADDYMTKPFSPKELLARVHAVLRRAHPVTSLLDYQFGAIAIDFAKMKLTRKGEPVPLTAQAFKVLRYFATNPERVISREELLNEVWGYNCYPETRTVDNFILKLRQKLEDDPAQPVHFLTVHGAGYKFVP
jgi:DNA-binding response OmpR family regulator